jgi:hypothetical protein
MPLHRSAPSGNKMQFLSLRASDLVSECARWPNHRSSQSPDNRIEPCLSTRASEAGLAHIRPSSPANVPQPRKPVGICEIHDLLCVALSIILVLFPETVLPEKIRKRFWVLTHFAHPDAWPWEPQELMNTCRRNKAQTTEHKLTCQGQCTHWEHPMMKTIADKKERVHAPGRSNEILFSRGWMM